VDRTAIALIAFGLALAAASGFADTLGIGDDRGFHYRQGIGIGIGAALVVAGIIIAIRRSREQPDRAAPSR
jgi:uncharacterized membrane protein YidH (DUF202 family)